MEQSKCFDYLDHVGEILQKVRTTQWEAIDRCARGMAEAIADGHSVYAFGASHAGILAQEMFYRTGGLAVLNAILPAELMLNVKPVTETSAMERLEGYAAVILKNSEVREGDVLLIHSVSGRNAAAIEMAMEAKKLGALTAAVTNMEYTSQVTSRHSSGKKLCDVCDIVIDNCGDFEDSSTLIPGMKQKVGPTSSVVGCAIVNMIVIRIVEHMLAMGVQPPVLHSANVDGGDEYNKVLFEKYRDQIHYL